MTSPAGDWVTRAVHSGDKMWTMANVGIALSLKLLVFFSSFIWPILWSRRARRMSSKLAILTLRGLCCGTFCHPRAMVTKRAATGLFIMWRPHSFRALRYASYTQLTHLCQDSKAFWQSNVDNSCNSEYTAVAKSWLPENVAWPILFCFDDR